MFFRLLIVLVLAAFPACAQILGFISTAGPIINKPGSVMTNEEFVGPFASWYCVQSSAGACGAANNAVCSATGNGSTDDTTTVQNCINLLSSSHPVIYFPCGTYDISTTLSVSAKTEIMLIGQDNTTGSGRCVTSLKWTGSSGGKLMNINGVNYSHFDRLTFDGNSLANVLVDQEWDGSTGQFDDSNQYIDDVFKNGNNTTTSYGFRCGFLGFGCSEVSHIRNTFSSLGFGVATCNANALDVLAWYSSFSSLRVAIGGDSYVYLSNGCGGGGFAAIGSVFSGSTTHDVGAGGAGDMSNVIDSYSSGSNQFDCCFGYVGLQRNTIVNTSVDGTAAGASVFISDHGMLLDNVIENSNLTAPYVGGGGLVVSIGNKYTNGSPFSLTNTPYNSGGGDQHISYNPPSAPTLPGVLPNNSRTIYEAGPSGSGTTCTVGSPCSMQTAVCKASNGASSTFSAGSCTGSADGLMNVAHLPVGTYSPSSTLVIPASSNAQIVCDGWQSVISTTSANPVISVAGPSSVTIRGCHLIGNTTTPVGDAIHISGVDQAGGYIYTRHNRLTYNSTSAVTSSLSNALAEVDAFEAAFGSATIDVTQSGSGHFNHFFGTGGRYALSGSANAQMIGGWLEMASGATVSTLTGSGSYVHSTAFMGFPQANDLFDLTNYSGTLAVLNSVTLPNSCSSYTGVAIKATGTAGGTIISGLNNYQQTSPITNTAGETLKFLGNAQSGCVTAGRMTDSPSPITSSDLSTVASDLTYFRATKPLMPNGSPSGTSSVALYDILTEGFVTAETFAP